MTEQDINEFIAPKGVLRNIPKGVKLIYKAHKQSIIDAKIDAKIEEHEQLKHSSCPHIDSAERLIQLKKEKNNDK